MENKKFEVGQLWRDDDGGTHRICDIDKETIYTFCYEDKKVFCFTLDGILKCHSRALFLAKPWQELRSGEVWLVVVEVLGAAHPCLYLTLEDAKGLKTDKAIARINVPWKEGQFDE